MHVLLLSLVNQNWGKGRTSLTKSSHPLAALVGEGINKDVKGKKKEGLDL